MGGIVEDLIVCLKRRYTLLLVTHNLAQARRIADLMALFWVQDGAGRLIETGPPGRCSNRLARRSPPPTGRG